MHRTFAAVAFIVLLLLSTVSCIPDQSGNVQAEIQSLNAQIAALQQKLDSTNQALSGKQYQNQLSPQQPQKIINNYGLTSSTMSMSLPAIVNFSASPNIIRAGQISNLQWNINGATSIYIDQGIGVPLSPYGQTISPAATTTYTLTAVNSAGSSTASVTVIVNPAIAVPVITVFTASPTCVYTGQSSTLQWIITGADSVSISPNIGIVSSSGTRVVCPTVATTYTLTAINSGGSTTAPVTITMKTYSSPAYPYYYYPYYRPHPVPPRPPTPHPPAPHPPFPPPPGPPGPPPFPPH